VPAATQGAHARSRPGRQCRHVALQCAHRAALRLLLLPQHCDVRVALLLALPPLRAAGGARGRLVDYELQLRHLELQPVEACGRRAGLAAGKPGLPRPRRGVGAV
jgi:hypothetical protein